MIFIDRSVPKPVAEALKKVRNDVWWLEDEFAHDAPEEEWLPVAGSNSWLTIVRDKKIRQRRGQRDMIEQHSVGCFIFTQKQDPSRWEYLQLLARNLDQMQQIFKDTQRPFIYRIDKQGALEKIYGVNQQGNFEKVG